MLFGFYQTDVSPGENDRQAGFHELSIGSMRRASRTTSRVSLIALLACTLSAWLGCTDSREESAKDKYEVDNQLSTAPGQEETASPIMNLTTGIAVETDIDKLLSLSQTLHMRANRVSFPQMMEDLDTQTRISDRILELADNEDQRYFAAKNKLNALLKRHSTADLKARERLLVAATELEDDPNREIRRAAILAQAVVRLTDYLRLEGKDDAEFDAQIHRLLDEYPEDETIAAEFQKMVVQMMIRKHRDKAVEFMDLLSKHYAKSTKPELKKLATVLADRKYLAEIEFDVVAEKFRRGIAASRGPFLKLIRQLARRARMSDEVYREVMWTVGWLESIDEYEQARTIVDIVEKNALPHALPELRERMAEEVAAAHRRLDQLGRQASLIGQNAAGNQVSLEDLRGKVVALFFWSASNPNSIRALRQLTQLHARYRPAGFEVVAACNDSEVTQSMAVFAQESPPGIAVYRAPQPDSQKSFDAFGIQFTPYLILIDRKGIIRDLNVPLSDLTVDVERLLAEPPPANDPPQKPGTDGKDTLNGP